MTDHQLDTFSDEDTMRLFGDFEQIVTAFNTTNISAVTGGVSVHEFLNVARVVSMLRADYIKQVMALGDIDKLDDMDPDRVHDIRESREAYQEALEGFGALRHALGRGYLRLTEDKEKITFEQATG